MAHRQRWDRMPVDMIMATLTFLVEFFHHQWNAFFTGTRSHQRIVNGLLGKLNDTCAELEDAMVRLQSTDKGDKELEELVLKCQRDVKSIMEELLVKIDQ